MHFFLRLIARERRMISVVAFLAATFALGGCGGGSQTGQASAPLPPAIPSTEPVLLYDGDGASSTDVAALEAILGNLSIGYTTVDSAHLTAMSEQQLGGYKLIMIPGGNSITIGQSLTAGTVSALRGAVQQYGVHYLGVCAGAFFGGYSIYNGVDLTSGVAFNFYADESKGIHVEGVEISFPNNSSLEMYWQDGPELSGWGNVVGKFPDGTSAIVEGQSGNGFVIFTGVHPEAPASWLGSMTFTTPVSVDQSYAATVIQAALSGTPLPHY